MMSTTFSNHPHPHPHPHHQQEEQQQDQDLALTSSNEEDKGTTKTTLLMKQHTTPSSPNPPCEYVTYTAFHEKLINFFVTLFTKHSQLTSCLLRSLLILSILLSFGYFVLTGNDSAIGTIWLPCVITLLALIMIVMPLLVREQRWETLLDVNNNFYEPYITTDVHHHNHNHYKPRKVEEIYYSNGVWRTCSTNQRLKFRGMNLPAKTPTYYGHHDDGHDDHPSIFYAAKKDVSFIDTPIPLSTAHEHFQRLSLYGFNLIRLIVTWEAVMHAGPGIIDTNYLSYLSHLIDIASQYGIYIIIDPHQDVWSRFTGGDGAPWWTLDVVGFGTDDDRLHTSGAAFVDHLQDTKDPKPKMIWTTNYGKVATATMFTLFFAGDVYAPGIHVRDDGDDGDDEYDNDDNDDNESNKMTIQSFLQKYYLQYFDVLAKLVKDKPNVIGFNSMNEPSNGYVGINDLTKRTYAMPFGYSMNYFDGMKVGCGKTVECQYYSAPFYYHSRKVINPHGISAWKTPDHDIWQKMGVYSINPETGEMQLNKPNYFSLDGKDFIEEYMVPLFEKIQQTITKHNPKFILYAEPFIDVNDHQHKNAPLSLDRNKFAWAPHWYDGSTLMLRKYVEWFALDDERKIPIVTKGWIDATFRRILGHVKESGNGKLHVILGEVGVPFDIFDERKDFEASTKALDRTMRAIEANHLDFTLWNYYPHNTIEHGDDWCGEDLSVRMVDRNRALLALIRPFVYKISDDFVIVRQRFDPSKRSKKFELIVKKDRFDGSTDNRLFVYLPHFHFTKPLINVSFGNCERIDKTSQLLIWDCSDMCAGRQAMLTIENGD